MELRLNKLISDSGLCSRREADKFIEMGRVTVNGKAPVIGKKVTEKDVVLVDGNRVNIGKLKRLYLKLHPLQPFLRTEKIHLCLNRLKRLSL